MAFSLPFLLLLLCCAAGARVSQAAPPLAAPSPSPDCSSELLNLVSCLSFVQNDSTAARPDAQCCSSLGKVVEEAPACICHLSSQGQAQSFNINVTKALTLPSDCDIPTPCNISGAPAAAAAASGPSPSCGAPSSVSGVEFLSGFAVALWLYYQSH
ncbi:non-specific lipid transfer protein GPI-anchored 2-like [Zingiber officinale]|uniref:non-specific lipid transfer protein GPI-anchored 2-like n=1 Tax=Zingiber officinale TaxID=94328 RepID=UPI001C4B1F1B|nr:non-specific lipid transfer protein GPI-anchored 2-like [Zingiber officinale]